jgi:gamma-glutamyl hydrolase
MLTIGIITVPLSPNKKYYDVCGDSYVSSGHIKWLEDLGVKVIPIPYTTSNHENYMKCIRGIYLPSGGVFASNNRKYYNCCKKFVELAKNANDSGEYFMIWGGCLGMQQLMMMAEGSDNMKLLDRFDSFENLMTPLLPTEDERDSIIMLGAPKRFRKFLEQEDCSIQNHMMGLSPKKFHQIGVSDVYKIVHVSYDRNNRDFVSTIEAHDYPFYGVQWHPERDPNMVYFANFIKDELNKNQKTLTKPPKKLKSVTIDCYRYSDTIYSQCTFYWHDTRNHATRYHDIKGCKKLG